MISIAPWKITVCGLGELPDHRGVGVTHVLSILDPEWPVPNAFGSFGEHKRLELRFHDVIEETHGMIAPREAHVLQLLQFGRDLRAEPPSSGAHLLVHCHAGVSRSTAAMILMVAQGRPDVAASVVAQEVFRGRQKAWPNLLMMEMGDRLLGRGGELVEAAKEIYRAQLERRPELAEFFAGGGRAREVEAAVARH
jgi:predicted protein tyrosine phosphatase